MKKTSSFLAVLIFLSTSLYAQKTAHFQKQEETDSYLQIRLEKPEKRTLREDPVPGLWNINNDRHGNNLKSTDVIKQKLDSIVCNYWEYNSGQWSGNYKREFVYDVNGYNTKEITYDRASTGSCWIPSCKGESAYDLGGNRIQYIEYYWLGSTGNWSPQNKKEYAYTNGNLTHHILYNWEATYSLWRASSKEEFTYDNNGNTIQYIQYHWLTASSQWIPDYKSNLDYDACSNMLQCITFYWAENTSEWINSEKTAFTYNAWNQKISEIYFDWDEGTDLWKTTSKTDYSYDANDRNIQDISYSWETDQWVAQLKHDFSYDTYGNKIQNIHSYWDEASGIWTSEIKYEYAFDSEGNLTQTSSYLWDKTGSQWFNVKKTDYDYNNSFSFSDLFLPLFCISEPSQVPFQFNHMVTNAHEWTWDGAEWSPFYEFVLSYSPIDITSVSEPNTASLKVSPNPVSDYLTVTLEKDYDKACFELFDMQGKKVLSENVTNQGTVSLQGFSAGIYYYVIIAGQERQSGKLIKE